MKKKVLFLIQDLKHGGAEKVLINLANNLDKNKYEVTIKTLFNRGVHIKNIKDGVKYIPGLKWEIRGNSHIIRKIPAKTLFKFFVKDNYDIIVAFLEGNATRVLSGCTDKNTKKVAWVHIEMNSIKTAFKDTKEALNVYNSFDKTVFVSNTVKEAFERAAGSSLNNSIVLYNVNETEDIKIKSQEKITDVIYKPDEVNIVSVAKLVPSKGYDRLIPALSRINENREKKAHLYLLGIGEQKPYLENLVQKYNMEKYVTFLGFKENPYKYVAAADLYVCSSRREGFSTAVTEALVCGTPVVSTRCSGATELLGENNEYGIVVENSEEGIEKGLFAMLDNDKYKEYKKPAKTRGELFSTENTTRAVEDMFEGMF